MKCDAQTVLHVARELSVYALVECKKRSMRNLCARERCMPRRRSNDM